MDNFDNASLSVQSKHQTMFSIVAIMLIYFVMSPIIGETYSYPDGNSQKIIFPNFLIWGNEYVGFFTKLAFILPLFIGAAILVVGYKPEIPQRTKAITFLACGFVLFIILLSAFGKVANLAGTFSFGALNNSLGSLSAFQFIGWIFMLAAGTTIINNKINTLTFVIGSIGATAYLISLVIPIYGVTPIEAPFKMFSSEFHDSKGIMAVSGILSLAGMASLITASVFCYRLWSKPYQKIETGRRISKYWWISQGALWLMLFYIFIAGLSEASTAVAINAIILLTKVFAFLYGTFFLMAYGISYFLIFVDIPSLSNIMPEVNPQFRQQYRQNDIEEQMLKLKSLLDKDLITVEEYDRKKTELLDRFN